ncbi:unnamed protein product, partial [Rangifer tarandus platyrhynchus]
MQGAARGARWSAATALGSARVRLQRAARRGAGRGGARRAGRGEEERGPARGAGPAGSRGEAGAGEQGRVGRCAPPLGRRLGTRRPAPARRLPAHLSSSPSEGRWRDLPRPHWAGAAVPTCSGRGGGSAGGFFP